jgi:hypothetical protein
VAAAVGNCNQHPFAAITSGACHSDTIVKPCVCLFVVCRWPEMTDQFVEVAARGDVQAELIALVRHAARLLCTQLHSLAFILLLCCYPIMAHPGANCAGLRVVEQGPVHEPAVEAKERHRAGPESRRLVRQLPGFEISQDCCCCHPFIVLMQGLNATAMQLLTPFKALLGVAIGKMLAGEPNQLHLAKTVLQLFASYTTFIDIKLLQDLMLVPLLSEVLQLPQLQVRTCFVS